MQSGSNLPDIFRDQKSCLTAFPPFEPGEQYPGNFRGQIWNRDENDQNRLILSFSIRTKVPEDENVQNIDRNTTFDYDNFYFYKTS